MIIPASIGWILEVVLGGKKCTSTYFKDIPSHLWLEQLSRRSKTRWLQCLMPTWWSNSNNHSWKMVLSIQALELWWYTTGRLLILKFLKQQGFLYLPITRGLILCEPSAFAHNAMERRSIFFLHPESLCVASVRSGSNLHKNHKN